MTGKECPLCTLNMRCVTTTITSVTPGTAMVLVVDTTKSAGTTVALPLRGAVDVSIDWGGAGTGCGTVAVQSANRLNDVSCTYTTAGTYTVRVSGTFARFGSGSPYAGSDKITAVTSFGAVSGVTGLSGAFYGASNLVAVPASARWCCPAATG